MHLSFPLSNHTCPFLTLLQNRSDLPSHYVYITPQKFLASKFKTFEVVSVSYYVCSREYYIEMDVVKVNTTIKESMSPILLLWMRELNGQFSSRKMDFKFKKEELVSIDLDNNQYFYHDYHNS